MPPIRFAEAERRTLRQIARTTGDARVLRRAQVLLDLDRGDSVERVAQRYQVCRSTVYNWVARYGERGRAKRRTAGDGGCGCSRPGGAGIRPRLRPSVGYLREISTWRRPAAPTRVRPVPGALTPVEKPTKPLEAADEAETL